MSEHSERDYVKGIVEALLFISEKPVAIEQLNEVIAEANGAEIRQAIGALQAEYEEQRRGMVILEIAGGYQMLSSPHYTDAIRRFFKKRVKEKLSKPALETLAIIAYKQPVSRADIELIRGVNSDGVVAHLLSKGLIKIVGRKDIPGRPFIHGTTKQFLEYFGLKSLRDLPKLEDFPSLISAMEGGAADQDASAATAVPSGASAAEGAEGLVDFAEDAESPAAVEGEPAASGTPAGEDAGAVPDDDLDTDLEEDAALAVDDEDLDDPAPIRVEEEGEPVSAEEPADAEEAPGVAPDPGSVEDQPVREEHPQPQSAANAG